MTGNKLPTTMSLSSGMRLWPFLIPVGDEETGMRLEPNELYCKEDNTPIYEWVPGAHNFTGFFRAMLHNDEEMAPIVEAVDD